VGRSFRPPRPEFPPLAKVSGLRAPEYWPSLRHEEVAQPLAWGGVSGLQGRSFRPWPNFPVPGHRSFGPSRRIEEVLSSWCGAEFPAPTGRSFRPRPEFPVTRAGNSGVILLCNGYFSGRGIYTPPSTSSQPARPEYKIPIVASSRITRSPNPSTQTC